MRLRKISPIIVFILLLSSCYSVFSGATGGLIVDAESTSSPKAGIANVDVYAYTSESERDADFNSWVSGTCFEPKAEYYGHTTTDASGNFVISKLVWKAEFGKSTFGKDADTREVYLLYYHENYGLNKGDTLIVSDSTSDTVYEELTAVRKSTDISLNFIDVTSENPTGTTMYVSVTVPQTTATNTTAAAITYEQMITGTGIVRVTYPRWQSDEAKAAGTETKPTVIIKYYQSAEKIDWAGCYNADNEDKNYAFRTDAVTGISKTVENLSYELNFYGKPTTISMPAFGGQYISDATTGTQLADDGVIISLARKDADGNYTIDCGQVTTGAQQVGSTGTEKHGMFTGLGAGYTWTDTTYTGKFAETDIQISANGTPVKTMTVRSDVSSYNVQL